MKRVLLDTSAYSYLMRGNVAVSEMLDCFDEVLLCTIVIGELLAGFKKGDSEKKNISILREFLSVVVVKT